MATHYLPACIVKHGDSFAVQIPKELMLPDLPEHAEISRNGDTFIIKPRYPLPSRKLTGLATKFAAFSPGFMAGGRVVEEETNRRS